MNYIYMHITFLLFKLINKNLKKKKFYGILTKLAFVLISLKTDSFKLL